MITLLHNPHLVSIHEGRGCQKYKNNPATWFMDGPYYFFLSKMTIFS